MSEFTAKKFTNRMRGRDRAFIRLIRQSPTQRAHKWRRFKARGIKSHAENYQFLDMYRNIQLVIASST